MSTVSSPRHAPRRQSQDGSADIVVVNLEASSPVVGNRNLEASPPVVGNRRGVPACVAGAQNSPIDVEAIEDEVHIVSPSRVPPPRTNRRTRQPVTVVDLEIEGSQEGMFHDEDASMSSPQGTNAEGCIASLQIGEKGLAFRQIRRSRMNRFLPAQYVGIRWRSHPQRLVVISSAARALSKPSRFRRNVLRAGRA
ncbi:unnamed protein product [Urochloa humidicola]